MNKKEIYAGLREILFKKFKLDEGTVKPEAMLDEDLGLDSVEVMDAVCLFEEKFNVKIIEGVSQGFTLPDTIEGLTDLIAERLNRRLAK